MEWYTPIGNFYTRNYEFESKYIWIDLPNEFYLLLGIEFAALIPF